ncbi:hypothetical protein HYC85_019733 [Camellia sinensis]|uniref:Uncharacterized protein n=1 Tax=Camellia sinensis TaxID=4442 RepID=A0A7J7GQA3_CAMSI|nr:hypothetical protein HYC85_019733 [Camellia sinensis]
MQRVSRHTENDQRRQEDTDHVEILGGTTTNFKVSCSNQSWASMDYGALSCPK